MSRDVAITCDPEIREIPVSVDNGTHFTIAINAAANDPVANDYLNGVPYQKYALQLMLQFITPGRTVLDIGAHIGTFTLTAAAAGAEVIAVEAGEENALLLARSVELNAFNKVHLVNAVAGNETGQVDFCSHGPWGFVATPEDHESGQKVEAVRVEDLLQRLDIAPEEICFVKIDVEGSEVNTLRGMQKLLQLPNAPPVLFESSGLGLEKYGFTPEVLFSEFDKFGYVIYRVQDFKLVQTGIEDLQIENCLDFLAIKGPQPEIANWQWQPVRRFEELLSLTLFYGRHEAESFRGWVASALKSAPRRLRFHSQIQELLRELQTDQSHFVRKRTEWWNLEQASKRAGPKISVLHLSTWNDRCGIADYAENLVQHLDQHSVSNNVFPLSVREMRWMTQRELSLVFRKFLQSCGDTDLIHIQHEFSFFRGAGQFKDSCRQFGKVLRALKAKKIQVVVTFHTEPELRPLQPGFKAWSKAIFREVIWKWHVARQFRGRRGAYAITHTNKTRFEMISSGFASSNVKVVPMGHVSRHLPNSNLTRQEAKQRLGIPPDCVLLSIFGFISYYKGHVWAVQALERLPANYHLAIIGGSHPDSEGDLTIDSVLQLWQQNNPGRLIITGYASREQIDLFHAATDICLAPYLPCNLSSSAAITWAISSGRPVIGSRIPAFREINAEHECMAMVTPYAIHELKWQIERLASDHSLQEKLVRNAREFAEKNSWTEVAGAVELIYRDLLKQSGKLRENQEQDCIGT
jgi:FkbM family methyltransferase